MKLKEICKTPKSAKKINVPFSVTTNWVTKYYNNKKANTTFKIIVGFTIIFIISLLLTINDNPKPIEVVNAEYKEEVFKWNENSEDLHTSVQYKGYNQAVTAYKAQIGTMVAKWYSNTRMLDLLALKSMECHQYDGNCKGLKMRDIWPFQINIIHREQYDHSLKLMKSENWSELFVYQLNYANGLVESYMDRFCNKWAFDYIGMTYTNEKRFKCVAVSYNWSPRFKQMYSELAWEKRKIIAEWLKENSNLFDNE